MKGFTESEVEEAALAWLEAIGWRIVHGPDIAPDTPGAERAGYGEVVLEQRLRDALVLAQSESSRRGDRGRFPQAHPTRRGDARSPQPLFSPDGRERRDGGIPRP